MKDMKKQNSFKNFFGKYWLLLFTILVGILFGLAEPAFFKYRNLLNIVSNASIYAIMGIGLTCLACTGQIDLSLGAQVSMSTTIMCVFLNQVPIYALGIVVTIVCMLVIGAFNSLLHCKIGIPGFIATQGTTFLITGITKKLTGGLYLANLKTWPSVFTYLGQHYLFGVIPMPVIVLLIISIIVIFITERTRIGRYFYAVGSNQNACKYLGISSGKMKFIAFLICGILCAISGIVLGSMVNGGGPGIADSYELTAITVVMLGATFIYKGVFNVPGTVVASILVAVIGNGLSMISAPVWASNGINGLILLISVVFVTVIRRKET